MTYEPIPRERARWRVYNVTLTRSDTDARRAPGLSPQALLKRVALPAKSEHGATALARWLYEAVFWAPVHVAHA